MLRGWFWCETAPPPSTDANASPNASGCSALSAMGLMLEAGVVWDSCAGHAWNVLKHNIQSTINPPLDKAEYLTIFEPCMIFEIPSLYVSSPSAAGKSAPEGATCLTERGERSLAGCSFSFSALSFSMALLATSGGDFVVCCLGWDG